MALTQSNDEVIRICDEWARNFCPPNVIPNENNAKLIVEHCFAKHGIVSISGLSQSAQDLGAALDLVPEPPKLTPQQKLEQAAAKEQARQRKDYLDSIRQQESFEDRVRVDEAKKKSEKATKDQADAKNQLELAVAAYQAYGLGRVDYLATETVQKDLRGVFITVKGKRDYVRTLEFVKRVLSLLPDHPKMGDVQRVVESLRSEIA